MRQVIRLFAVLIAALCAAPAVYAHGGRTDGQGCHHDRRNGGYHCHGGGHAPSHSVSTASLGLYSPPPRSPVQSVATSPPEHHHAPQPKADRPACSDASRADREKIMTMEMQIQDLNYEILNLRAQLRQARTN